MHCFGLLKVLEGYSSSRQLSSSILSWGRGGKGRKEKSVKMISSISRSGSLAASVVASKAVTPTAIRQIVPGVVQKGQKTLIQPAQEAHTNYTLASQVPSGTLSLKPRVSVGIASKEWLWWIGYVKKERDLFKEPLILLKYNRGLVLAAMFIWLCKGSFTPTQSCSAHGCISRHWVIDLWRLTNQCSLFLGVLQKNRSVNDLCGGLQRACRGGAADPRRRKQHHTISTNQSTAVSASGIRAGAPHIFPRWCKCPITCRPSQKSVKTEYRLWQP